jgi:CRP-like cAMP-binding protein
MSAPTFGPSQNLIRLAAIFEGLSSVDLKRVLSRASLQTVPTGALLFRQGDPATEIFLLESGRVRLNEVTMDGRELLIRFVRPGEVCGDKADRR